MPVSAPPIVYTAGLDLGQAQDFTALAVIETQGEDAERRHALRHLHRYPLRTSYPEIVESVTEVLGRAPLSEHRTTLMVDATGVGRPVVELLRRQRLRAQLTAVTITGGTTVTEDTFGIHVPKRDLVSALQVLLQSGALHIARDLPLASTLITELQGFRVRISATGHDSYAAGEDWRSAPHDDLVLAVALAAWQAAQPPKRWGILL
jgi:hypothetical protein